MSSQRGVHNRIHNLRGEQFRHLQNIRGSRSHLSSHNIHTVPSLPLRLLSLTDPSLGLTRQEPESSLQQPKSNSNSNAGESESDGTSFRPPAGPTPPKSWTLNSRKDIRGTTAWRSEALSLILNHLVDSQQLVAPSTSDASARSELPDIPQNPELKPVIPRIPSLSLLCLQIFLNTCTTSEFRDEIVPYIPSHLRKDLIRFTAVHSPLSTARLYALWEPAGHADGEMIVVGPGAVLKDDYFIRSHSGNGSGVKLPGDDGNHELKETEDWDWDAEETDMSLPLHSLILLNTSLSSSTLFSFPPTLTHLALINLATPVPLHRLPNICPLIIILDVSYNSWLGANFGSESQGGLGEPQPPRDPTIKAIVDLGRVDWPRWSHLKVLGFRGNYIPENFARDVNEARWDDIEVVL
ncbi:hypothetical protein D9756_001487 [Leucocoprinus leucothites]|uniref:Uncharacterized protein n=1 Tax=Leucocoprinus leucothites TaxID=201217 RepID=A0A8H5G570_9AGAR|nr:hypothetical protein D9756_001487 [Leucoagaricus leucothites]